MGINREKGGKFYKFKPTEAVLVFADTNVTVEKRKGK